MKLFDTIFHLLLDEEKILSLNSTTKIHAIKDDNGNDHNYYITTKQNDYIEDSEFPNREMIEEFLTYIILKKDPRIKKIENFVSKQRNKTTRTDLAKALRTDHPKLTKRVEKYLGEEGKLIDAAVKIRVEGLVEKSGSSIIFTSNRDYISELSYKDHVFTYTESERGGPATPIQTFSSNEEARKFIIDKGHITFQDGRLTGKIIFAVKLRLEDKYNLHTVREYLDSIS